MTHPRTLGLLTLLIATLVFAGCDSDESDDGGGAGMRTFEVTIENRTQGQPFSPGVIVTHNSDFTLWEEGERSSPLIRRIAEDGFPLPTIINDVLGGNPDIDQILQFHDPMMPIGANLTDLQGPPTSDTFTITADEGIDRISIATMIICTNDGFTGLNSVELPDGGEEVVFEETAYDAGSEQNTEAFPDIVDGCTLAGPVRIEPDGNRDDEIPEEDRIINEHPGIDGGADLVPAEHGWDDPVSRITIREVQ